MGATRVAALSALLVALLLQCCVCKWINSVVGPFRIVFGHLERCPPELDSKVPLVYYYGSRRSRYNPNVWYYWGNVTFPFPYGDDNSIKVNIASWSSRGGWKENAHVRRMDHACTSFKTYLPELWKKLCMDTLNQPDDDCPVRPKTFVYKNITTDFSVKTVPVFFYGKYRITFQLVRSADDEVLGCIRGFGDVVPEV